MNRWIAASWALMEKVWSIGDCPVVQSLRQITLTGNAEPLGKLIAEVIVMVCGRYRDLNLQSYIESNAVAGKVGNIHSTHPGIRQLRSLDIRHTSGLQAHGLPMFGDILSRSVVQAVIALLIHI